MSSGGRAIVAFAAVTVLCGQGTGQVQKSPPLDWAVNPYRNFLASWVGQETLAKTGKVTPVSLTITEDKAHARMVWEYGFGVPGQKGFSTARKYIVFSPADRKMLMNFEGEPGSLYDVPDMAAFTNSGAGTLVATETYRKSNYWHVKRAVTAVVTFELQANTLSYRWDVSDRGDTSLYSEFKFTRVLDRAHPSTRP